MLQYRITSVKTIEIDTHLLLTRLKIKFKKSSTNLTTDSDVTSANVPEYWRKNAIASVIITSY